jgi:hypothetical protein
MKKLFLFCSCLIMIVSAHAQIEDFPRPGQGNLGGGLGFNWIDGNLYYNFNIRPELSIANFGAGLDLNIDIDKNGNIRKEDFLNFSDYLNIIRYIRYGTKNEPVYVQLGALDYYTLGYGNIILNYNNSPSYDARRIGLVTDIDFGEFGVESIYSNFLDAGIVGIRGYLRPLKFTSAGNIPIIGNLTVGMTYAVDFNKYAGIVFDQLGTTSLSEDKGSINIEGIDLGLPLYSSRMLGLQFYTDAAKIINFGSGAAVGIKADLNGLGFIKASAQFERRFNNSQFIAGYFNPLYEIERYQYDSASGIYSSKATKLADITNPDNGYFGELYANALGLFYVLGTYERLDKTPYSGVLHLEANAAPESLPFILRAGYDKVNISSETEIFTLDNRSLLYFEFGYKPSPYIVVSMLYKWTFAPVYDSNNNIINYQPQKRIEPRVTFEYPFNYGNSN